jgi:hypothetical protein
MVGIILLFCFVFLFSEGFLVRGHCLVCGQEAKKAAPVGEKIEIGFLGFFHGNGKLVYGTQKTNYPAK